MMREPWNQRDGEPGDKFEQFTYYLSRGPKRSLADVARHFGVHRVTVERTSVEWGWKARCEAWSAFRGKQRMAALHKALKDNTSAEIAVFLKMWSGLVMPSVARLAKAYRDDKTLHMGIRDLREVSRDVAAALATLRGEPSTIVGMSQVVPEDEARAELLRAVQRKQAELVGAPLAMPPDQDESPGDVADPVAH